MSRAKAMISHHPSPQIPRDEEPCSSYPLCLPYWHPVPHRHRMRWKQCSRFPLRREKPRGRWARWRLVCCLWLDLIREGLPVSSVFLCLSELGVWQLYYIQCIHVYDTDSMHFISCTVDETIIDDGTNGIWTFDQLQGVVNVNVPVRMTVVKVSTNNHVSTLNNIYDLYFMPSHLIQFTAFTSRRRRALDPQSPSTHTPTNPTNTHPRTNTRPRPTHSLGNRRPRTQGDTRSICSILSPCHNLDSAGSMVLPCTITH